MHAFFTYESTSPSSHTKGTARGNEDAATGSGTPAPLTSNVSTPPRNPATNQQLRSSVSEQQQQQQHKGQQQSNSSQSNGLEMDVICID